MKIYTGYKWTDYSNKLLIQEIDKCDLIRILKNDCILEIEYMPSESKYNIIVYCSSDINHYTSFRWKRLKSVPVKDGTVSQIIKICKSFTKFSEIR